MLFRSDRKSTRLNSSHTIISYAVFCLKKKKASRMKRSTCSEDGARSELVSFKRRVLVRASCSLSLPSCLRPVSSRATLLFFFLMIRRPPRSTLFPSTPLFRSWSRRTSRGGGRGHAVQPRRGEKRSSQTRSEEHTSELQSHDNLVCRLLLEK